MRTAQIAPVLATGLLLTLAFAALPASAGCTYLLNTPTGCATAIYNNEKAFVSGKAVGAEVWIGNTPPYVSACPTYEGGDVPEPPSGEIPANAYVSDLEDAFEEFQAGAEANVFPAAGLLVGNVWFSTVDFVVQVDDGLETFTLPSVPEDPDDIGFPEADPDDAVGTAQAYVDASIAAATTLGEQAQATVDCVQAMPAP